MIQQQICRFLVVGHVSAAIDYDRTCMLMLQCNRLVMRITGSGVVAQPFIRLSLLPIDFRHN